MLLSVCVILAFLPYLAVDALSWRQKSTDSIFGINVTRDGRYYILHVNGQSWLYGRNTHFTMNGQSYDTKTGSLKLQNVTNESGKDLVGEWQSTSYHYLAGSTPIRTAIKMYTGISAVIFIQDYHQGATVSHDRSNGGTISAFPSFRKVAGAVELGFLGYGGIMCGDIGKKYGRWPDDKFDTDDYGGPLVLFDKTGNTLITSPMSEFMAAASTITYDDDLAWGIMGGPQIIPPGFVYQTVLYFSDQGINKAMEGWGAMLRKYYNRTDHYRKTDLTVNYLGFWMDGGAFYEFTTEKFKDYDETIMDIKAYADSWNIPYRYTEIDEWFYCPVRGECNKWGTIAWTPVPYIFPNGIKYISEKTGWPIHASNKWWSSDTIYAKQNGGNFTFYVDIGHKASLPQDQNFWDFLMKKAKEQNIIVYEQDFQDYQMEHMSYMHTDVTAGRKWLTQMGRAAQKHGLTLQYCMARSWNIMQALEIPVVTQARVSQDYVASLDMWKIGVSSMFADAMGIAPFKDNFFTGNSPPYELNSAGKEDHPGLQSVVATLSTGPVGPSDRVGCSHPDIIKRCCNADGLILQPSKPATAIDKQILQSAFGGGIGPLGEVWTTFSNISGHIFGIILCGELNGNYILHPSDANFETKSAASKVFSYVDHGGLPQFSEFSEENPLNLRNCTPKVFCLYHTTPTFTVRGIFIEIIGEISKWVPMSPKRVHAITLSTTDITLSISGKGGEEVMFWFRRSRQLFTVKCVLPNSGKATISVLNKTCTPL